MDMEKIQDALENIEYLASDVNYAEIYTQFAFGNLTQWSNAWKNAMFEQLKKLREELKNEPNE